jgi:signal transduction histidine kinase
VTDRAGWPGWLLLGALWLGVWPAAAAQAPAVRTVDTVYTLELPAAQAHRDQTVDRGTPVDLPMPEAAGAWEALSLPAQIELDTSRSPEQRRQIVTRWLRTDVALDPLATGPLALYIPRVEGASVQVAVLSQGVWRMVWDGSEHWREQWNRPVLVDLGAAPPAASQLSVAVGLVHYGGGPLRVAHLQIGARQPLADRAAWREVLQLTAPQVGSLTFLTLGVFALLYWRGRRQERAYLLFFLSSLVWWMGNLHYYSLMPTGRAAYQWFWWMTDTSLSWTMVLIYFFALRFDTRRAPRLERGLIAFVAVISLIAMPFSWSPLHSQVQQHLINAVVALLVLGWLTAWAWRGGTREFRVITAVLWVNDLMGLHDLLLVANVVPPESIYLLPFASQLLFLAFLYAVQRRYGQAIDHVEQVNADLERKLAEREAHVRANNERIAGIEREQALLLERQRLMRDMHDGLGSTLMSTLVLVEQGRLDSKAVAALLRECVDDLRLVIDSLEPIGHDLITLLASLRHRLGRRLESAGLVMHWEVEDLPPLEWLQPPDALQVLRIVQEVLTNVLKHSGASSIRLATHLDGAAVVVLLEDDGVGFDLAQASRGRGLRHLSQRAGRLGGRLTLDSAPGHGTRVRLELPLQRGSGA